MNSTKKATICERLQHAVACVLITTGVLATGVAFGFTLVTLLKRVGDFDDIWVVHSEAIAGFAALLAIVCFGAHLGLRLARTRRR